MTLSKKSLLLTGVAVVATLLIAAPASAITIGFTKITNNGNSNVASQLSADVTDHGDGTVDFTFYNDVGIASSISEIYFDDGTLLALSSISDSGAGVAFTGPPTNPGDLPGGNLASPPFHVSQGFSADSGTPKLPMGSASLVNG